MSKNCSFIINKCEECDWHESKVINLIDIFGKDVVIEKIRIKKILFVEIEKAIYQ